MSAAARASTDIANLDIARPVAVVPSISTDAVILRQIRHYDNVSAALVLDGVSHMSKLIYIADTSNQRPGRGATIRLDSGEPCTVSIAQSGVRVKKSRFGLLGPVLYNEKNIYQAALTAEALSSLFPNNLLPPGINDPVLIAFANAIMHCSTCAEVAVTLNETVKTTPPESVKPPPPMEGGTTPDSAIKIHAANSIEGIPKEYALLTAMFGKPNRDWKRISRSVIDTDDGRKLEKFILSVAGKRKEIYFDITLWMEGNKQPQAKAALDRIIAPHDKNLEILLPKEEFMTLEMGLINLTEAQLAQIGLSPQDRKQLLDPILDTQKQWKDYKSIPAHVGVTMLMSRWTNIMGLLASWKPASLLQEEELENLKAIIGGTMKQAR
jgi:hypothetical protein